MLGALRGSSLYVLLMLIQKAFSRAGFGDVEIMDRRLPRQRTRYGGYELMCTFGEVDRPRRMLVKVIHGADVRVRSISEMAGEVDRHSADLGFIITTHRVCRSARQALAHYTKSRIETMEGEELADLITRQQIGTRPNGGVNYAYFSQLEEIAHRLRAIAEKELK